MEKKTLGEVANYINGRAFKPNEWEKEGLPIIRIQNLTNSTDVCNRTTKTYEEKYLVKDGDLLFAWSASLGAHIWHGEDGWLNQHIFKVIPYKGTDKIYLYYYLLHIVEQLYAKTHGSGMVHITLKPFKNTEIYLPSLPEQRRIVDRLDRLFAKLDAAKEKLQSVLDRFERRRYAILHKAFTGELTANWRKARGIGIESWRNTSIDAIAEVKGGKRVPKGMALTKENTGHPYIRAGNLKQGTVIDDDIMYVSDDILQHIQNYTVNAGDVCITNVGACIGDCSIIPSKYDGANLTENAVKITNLKCDNKFLYYYISSNAVQERIKRLIASATLGKLSIANIKQIPVILPAIDEQKKLVNLLEYIFTKEQRAKDAAEAALTKIDRLKKSLLARAFRAQLGTHDPADPSAAELLKTAL